MPLIERRGTATGRDRLSNPKLRDRGALTDDEFEDQKKRLLAQESG